MLFDASIRMRRGLASTDGGRWSNHLVTVEVGVERRTGAVGLDGLALDELRFEPGYADGEAWARS
jgi:hypothetical protein